MILVEQEIAALVEKENLIESYDERCLTNIGYDVRAKQFMADGEKKERMTLQPGESVFVSSVESIDLCSTLLCRVVLKNSRIRQGFTLDAPVYQPGHHTRIFFRLTNVSGDELFLEAGECYATLIFEQLSAAPKHPYKGAFSDEFDFRGLGSYRDVYKNQMREIEKKSEDLKSMERSIYANILVILTVFVALFSFLTANVSQISAGAEVGQILLSNFIMLGGIAFLVALLDGVLHRARRGRGLLLRWIPAILCLGAAFCLLYIV